MNKINTIFSIGFLIGIFIISLATFSLALPVNEIFNTTINGSLNITRDLNVSGNATIIGFWLNATVGNFSKYVS